MAKAFSSKMTVKLHEKRRLKITVTNFLLVNKAYKCLHNRTFPKFKAALNTRKNKLKNYA